MHTQSTLPRAELEGIAPLVMVATSFRMTFNLWFPPICLARVWLHGTVSARQWPHPGQRLWLAG